MTHGVEHWGFGSAVGRLPTSMHKALGSVLGWEVGAWGDVTHVEKGREALGTTEEHVAMALKVRSRDRCPAPH